MSSPDEIYDEAIALKEAGEVEAAIEKMKSILEIDEKHEEALTHAQKVIELEPSDPFSFTQLSVICQRCGLIQEAEDAMAKARELQGGGCH